MHYRLIIAYVNTVSARSHSRPVFAAIAVAVALPVVFGALTGLARLGVATFAVTSLVPDIMAAYATVCAVVAYWSGPRSMRALWAVTAFALAACVVGRVIWEGSERDAVRPPGATAADAFFLTMIVLIAVAMLLFPIEPKLRLWLRGALEGLAAGLCLLLLAWVLVLNDVYDAYHGNVAKLVLAFSFPIVCVVSLAIAVGTLVGAEPTQRKVLWVLTVAIGLLTIACSAYARAIAGAGVVVGDVINIGATASFGAFAAAALMSRDASTPVAPAAKLPPNSSLWLPYLPLLLAGTIGPAIVMNGFESLLVPCIVVAVCARQSVAAWENRRLLRQTAEQALRDPLTGLANRTLFTDRLTHAMLLRTRDRRTVAVVSLDVDDFKLVNDSLGHPTADRVLTEIGRRISASVRAGDTAARLGGDEFAILLEEPIDDADLVVRQVVEAIDEPFSVGGHELLMRPSIGVAVASPTEPELTADELLKRADVAMYTAKRSRSIRVHTFDPSTDVVDAAVDADDGQGSAAADGAARVRLFGELRHAIDLAALTLVYQPIFDLRS